ncbi:MAG: extracellular solute-binding protein [Peptococcaceae bacterium]|jgi:phosphate transport system substrate-binding protein|nr:extracellular solute-binding protein [Peptococcaceae bacterium]
MKKNLGLCLAALLLFGALTGCGGNGASNTASASGKIYVISREDGSGTRSAFIELFGVEEKDADGQKVDRTIATAEKTNNTAVMMTSVANDKNAIGYLSLGSLGSTVKALKIDGVVPSLATVKDGSYTVTRPFNIVTNGSLNAQAQEFLDFILSNAGQDVVEQFGCVRLDQAPAFSGGQVSGKVVVAGSSSVSPLMEKLQEAYKKMNPNVTVEIQTSDSSTGINAAIEQICDIGMSSRELKDSEKEKGVRETPMATDAIVVIVHPNNALDGLSKEQVKSIYTGGVSTWSEVM